MSWSGIILVIAGALLLANNFGLLQWGWLAQWWPIFLIALGVWSILRPGSRSAPSTRRDGDDAGRSANEGERRP